jgi:uncharacterized protein YigE (DUF2233 family)
MISRRAVLGGGVAVMAAVRSSPARAVPRHAVFTADLSRHEVSLHWRRDDGEPFGNLLALRMHLEQQGKRVLCLTNAGIYARDFTPLGLHVQNGDVLRSLNEANGGGNFFLKPNGVFAITAGGATVRDTSAFTLSDDVLLATQSGPLLFDERGFHPRFLRDATSHYVRNGVGVRDNGEIVFAITNEVVTFWQFATLMRDELGCASALYLDGNISALWHEGAASMPAQWRPFVGMLAVTELSANS